MSDEILAKTRPRVAKRKRLSGRAEQEEAVITATT